MFFLLILRFFFSLVFASYTSIIILFMRNELGLTPAGLGLALSLIGLFSVLNQAVVVKKVTQKIGGLRTLYTGMLLIIGGLISLPLLPTNSLSVLTFPIGLELSLGVVVVLLNAYVMNLGISVAMPNFKSLFSKYTSDSKQGLVIGLDESLMALGNAITPVIAGSIYTLIGPSTFWIFAGVLILPNLYQYLRTGSLSVKEPHHAETTHHSTR